MVSDKQRFIKDSVKNRVTDMSVGMATHYAKMAWEREKRAKKLGQV